MPIVVLQHADSDGLGRLAPILRDHGHVLDVRRLDLPAAHGGRPLPTDLDGVTAVISLGGPMNVGDGGHPWMEPEMDFLRRAHAQNLPVIGLCLGAQLLAVALGGEVGPMTAPTPGEFGFCPVDITVPGQTETIMAGITWSSRQWQAHGQMITKLPPGSTLLATSKACQVQAFKVAGAAGMNPGVGLRTYGFQYHFESDRADIDTFLADPWSQQLMASLGLTAGDVARSADEHYPTFERLGTRLSTNLAQYLFPPVSRLR